jgi:[lysine-biosynthesis-protein LysW]---L-2-aminoadipate ligase
MDHELILKTTCVSISEVPFRRSGLHGERYYGLLPDRDACVAERCGDKYITSQILAKNGTPTPRVMMAFDGDSALRAIEAMGYPSVLKSVIGSWGCLLAKVENREMAETLIEYKATLGVHHEVFYIQEYIDKLWRDFRVLWWNMCCR